MNIWDKTEIEYGKKSIDELYETKNHVPIKIITTNELIKKEIIKYIVDKTSYYRTDFSVEDFMYGRKDNAKIYKLYTNRELIKAYKESKKDALSHKTNTQNIILANTITVNLKYLTKIHLRRVTGWNTGMLAI